MFEEYDLNVEKDEKGNLISIVLRTVRSDDSDPLVIGVKECVSKTNKDGNIISTTVSAVCLNVEYNVDFCNTRYCEFDDDGTRLYPNVNSIETIHVFQDGFEKLSIDNAYDVNGQLYLGVTRVGGSNFSYNARSSNNVYPFDSCFVSSNVRNFLGLHYNPERIEFHNGDSVSIVR